MANILVTGATGNLGKAVTDELLKKTNAGNISILVRNADKAVNFKEAGVNVHHGDYNDHGSLEAAFKGIDKIYLVSGNDIPNRLKQQVNVIQAAKEAGVKHIVYTSFQRKGNSPSSPISFVEEAHIGTEQSLKSSGMVYTILEHGLYTDVIPFYIGDKVLDTKTIFFPAGDGKVAFAWRTDMAEAGAIILTDETGKYNNRNIEITGNEAMSFNEVAGMISNITGSHIKYVSPPVEEYKDALKSGGMPEEVVQILAGFSQAIGEGAFDNVTNDLEHILGRAPKSADSFLRLVYRK